jgi:hypothetical protein
VRGETMQFLLNVRGEVLQCLLVALAPGNQQLRDTGFGLVHHCFILQGAVCRRSCKAVFKTSPSPARNYFSQVPHALRASFRRTGEEHSHQQVRPYIVRLKFKAAACPVLSFAQIPYGE